MIIQPTMTDARAAWLEELSQGPANRHRTVVGHQCMRLGWTEWHYVERETGVPISEAEARQRWSDAWFQHVRLAGERLTPEGWTVLRQHRDRQAKLAHR